MFVLSVLVVARINTAPRFASTPERHVAVSKQSSCEVWEDGW